jgi:glutathione S-transferase
MIESIAIMQYLLERHGQGALEPRLDSAERGPYLQWLHFAEANFARYVGDIVRNRHLKPEALRIPAVVDDARLRLRERLALLDSVLSDREYLLQSGFSAADVAMGYGLMLAKLVNELPAEYPHVSAYLARLEARPSYQKAMG